MFRTKIFEQNLEKNLKENLEESSQMPKAGHSWMQKVFPFNLFSRFNFFKNYVRISDSKVQEIEINRKRDRSFFKLKLTGPFK